MRKNGALWTPESATTELPTDFLHPIRPAKRAHGE